MALILFFLRAWSIGWTINLIGAIWAISTNRPEKLTFSFNLKTISELSLYATSIYSWFYGG